MKFKYLIILFLIFIASPVSAATVTKTIGTNSRDYSTITLWEADLDNTGIYSSGDDAVGEMYNDSVFDEVVFINGGVTVGLNSITLTVAEGERHDGSAGTGARIERSVAGDSIFNPAISNKDINIHWLELSNVFTGALNSGSDIAIYYGQDEQGTVSNLLIHDIPGSTNSSRPGRAIYVNGSRADVEIYNNIIYGVGGAQNTTSGTDVAGGLGINVLSNGSGHYISNNTVFEVLQDDASSVNNGNGIVSYSTSKVYNNLSIDNEGSDYSGSSANFTTNGSSDTTGNTGLQSLTSGNLFASTVEGASDFLHLKAGSPAIDAGTDLGTTPTGVNIDIKGRDRDTQGDTWDIGAHEYVAPAVASINAGSGTWDIDGDLDISSGTLTSSSGTLNLAGNYTNTAGTFTHNSGMVVLNGGSQQTLTGEMIGADAFSALTITNSSGGGDATNTPSVIFANVASTTGTFTAITSGTTARFPATATSTFTNIVWDGQSGGNEIKFRSATSGTQFGVVVTGTQSCAYVDFMDMNASDGNEILATDGTSVDSGNNTNITFLSGDPTMASAGNQVFEVGQAATAISQITVTEHISSPSITAANDLRIAIATSSVDMRWDTSDTSATIGGTASGKVSSTVSYEGGGGGDSVLVIPVNTNFAAGETLTISGLLFKSFNAVNAAISALDIFKEGASDFGSDADDTTTVAIKGAHAVASHDVGQENDKFDNAGDSLTDAELFSFKFTPSSESINTTNLVFSLSNVIGVSEGDITGAEIIPDFNGDGDADAPEISEAVGGAGAVSISDGSGTITFSTAFATSTARNYILRADVANLSFGDQIIVGLTSENITSSGITSSESITSTGSMDSATHVKPGQTTSGVSINADAPAGATTETGGESGAGETIDESAEAETIGSEVGFNAPTANSAPSGWAVNWTTPANAYGSDGNYATDDAGGAQDYQSFNFSIPAGNTINGIEVKFEASSWNASGDTIAVELSWDGGTSTTTSGNVTTELAYLTDTVYRVGGPSDNWGKADWAVSHFSDANFRVRVVGSDGVAPLQIDAMQVKVYHQATGGGGGGGGEASLPLDVLYANLNSAFEGLKTLLLKLF